MTLTINGRAQTIDLTPPVSLAVLLDKLGLKPDRIAVELNGEIVPRSRWDEVQPEDGAKLEIVHFVGGGLESFKRGLR